MAPIHETDDKVHKLYIYKICTEIIKNKSENNIYNKVYKRNSQYSENLKSSIKNNTSIIALEKLPNKETKNELKINSKSSIGQCDQTKNSTIY
jgi:flagellar motility protein MotE (MotC chaperone)